MINFLRKIREKLISESKFRKYLVYAIGEIVLVVIGILIALQINNWNESRKINESLHISIQSLLYDLAQDSVQLNNDILEIQMDLQRLSNFRERLSSPNANMDTLKKIARYEYLPFFNPSNELNRNTITSILSTGNIEYFREDVKSKILIHYSEQSKLQRVMDQNVSIFLGSEYAEGPVMQSENQDPMLQSAVIKGPLLEKYWADKGDDRFLDRMLSTLSGKIIMYKIILSAKGRLLQRTNQMITYLIDLEEIQD